VVKRTGLIALAECSRRFKHRSSTTVIIMAALRSRCGHYIFILFLFSFFLLFSSPNLSGRRLDVYHTSTHGVALLRIYNTGLKCTARVSLKIQDAKNRHLDAIAQLYPAVSSQLRHVSRIGKKLLNSTNSSTCPCNIVNFRPLTAEFCWRVWGTPANFSRFRVLAPLLQAL